MCYSRYVSTILWSSMVYTIPTQGGGTSMGNGTLRKNSTNKGILKLKVCLFYTSFPQ
jgi:hypothetical protein